MEPVPSLEAGGVTGLRTKYASALLALGDIPYEHAKLMSEEQICSLYELDHNIRKAEGGTDDFWNLRPRLIAAHREKTRRDIPEIWHNKRARNLQEAHKLRMADKEAGMSARPASKWRR